MCNVKPKVAILSYNHKKYSETFIHNLVKYLPAEVHYLYGGELPFFSGDGQMFMPENASARLKAAVKEFLGTSLYEQHQHKVESYFLNNGIQVVLANYAITAFPVMDICKRNNIPLVVHFHGWTAYRSTILEQHREDYIRLFQMAKVVVAVSIDMVEQLKRIGCPAHKIMLAYYGTDPEIFRYNDCSGNENTFLSAGRFCDTKNPHLTILAFSKVLTQIPDARLIMAGGDENLLNASVNIAKALKVDSKIEFCGVLSPAELYNEMQSAVAFVQHSATTILDEKEGTPVTILEACASGLPVIATRHAGIADVIIENETGLLCDEFDVDAMAANMVLLARDRQLAKRLGLNAAKRINESFTMQMYVNRIDEAIKRAMGEQPVG